MGQDGVGAEGKNRGRGGDPDTEFQYVAPSEEWVIWVGWGERSDACLSSFPTVGDPLPIPKIKKPNKETVDKYHALYISALCKLFDQHKVQYGLPETQELTII